SSSLQREAHSTALQTAVNTLFTAFDQPDRTINRTTQTALSMPAHSTRIRRPCNFYFRLTR
ncbi:MULTISPECIES: hypothetical protein, partial [unclassified Pseudomonas]|uniref:hypothetical protein n=1 Tax=unclassified Pseudomonas TaxID=196821 RepID=UPI0035C144B6